MVRVAVTAKFPTTQVTVADIGLFTNDEDVTITSDVTAGATTFPVDDATAYAVGMWVLWRGLNGLELCQVTAVDVVLKTITLSRGQDGTVGVAHTSGERGLATIPAKALNQMVAELIAVENLLFNGLFEDTKFRIVDTADQTKKLAFDVTGTTGITGTFLTQFTTAKTITFPDATDTVALLAASQTLTNKTIVAANNTISGLLHGTHVDNPSSGVHGVVGSVVGTTDVQTLTSKTLTTPTIGNFTNAQHAHTGASSGGLISHASLSNLTVDDHTQYILVAGTRAFAGDQSMGGFKITSLGTPSNPTDATTKAYVDAIASGLDPKASVRVATTAAGTLATDFENGDTIDGVVLATGDRILIKDQASGSENGIYTVNGAGAPTRATDADTSAEVTSGMFAFVSEGTVNADSGWVLTTNDPITLGVTSLAFSQFSGAGMITAGNGLTKTGNTLAVGAGTGILANPDDVAVDQTFSPTWTGTHSFQDTKFFIRDVTDGTKRLLFDIAGTTSVNGTIATAFTTAKTITLPDATDTLVGKATTDTLTNKTLTSSTNVLGGVTMTLGSDGTGDVYFRSAGGILTRLPIGSASQVLTVAAGLPSWATPTAASTAGTVYFPAGAAIIPVASGAQQNIVDGTNFDYIVLDFDAATDEHVIFQGVMPRDYNGGDVEFELQWFAAAITNTVKWVIDGRRVQAADLVDGAVTNMATFDGTPAGTTNQVVYTSVTAVTELTGLGAGEVFYLKLSRDADNAGDTMTGDARVIGLTMRYTRG